MNALLSVSDKTGIVELAQALHAQGIKLLSLSLIHISEPTRPY